MKGYLQVEVAPGDVPKTAIITPFGLFEFVRMPFGLKNAAQTFQRMMDRIFGGLPWAFVYLDDILVASSDMAAHLGHLEAIFKILAANGLVINPEKCCFAQQTVEFLGHAVSSAGILPLPAHVQAVAAFPRPANIKDLQRFLGMVNFFRRFLPGIARTLRPLTDALVGGGKLLQWSVSLEAAFTAAKAALAAATVLSHPDSSAEVALATDASDSHVGGVLQQRQCVKGVAAWRPLAFFSAKLSSTQQRYSTFDRELLAAFLAIRHFRFALEGREFQLHTDHKPLVTAISRLPPPLD